MADGHVTGCGCSTTIRLIGSKSGSQPTLDHKIPLARGGLHTRDNVHLLCMDCNVLKGTMTWMEFEEWNARSA